MRKLIVAIIALMAVLTFLALGLNDNQIAAIPGFFTRMHA
jgi:hypothetical protein